MSDTINTSHIGIIHFEQASTPGCAAAFIQIVARQGRGTLPLWRQEVNKLDDKTIWVTVG